jgi:ferric-dicitrate binding protein FerR (iron transport regulator)
MDYNEVEQLVVKFLEGTSSVAEENQLRTYFSQEKNIPNELMPVAAMFVGFSQAKQTAYRESKSLKSHLKYAVAACVFIALGLLGLFIIDPFPTEVIVEQNNSNEPQKVTIAKNKLVWLKQGAEISYVKGRRKELSVISIKGEAYFDFSESKQTNYQVLAHNAIIKVETPAAFNVQMLPAKENINITVKSGAIKIQEGSNDGSLTLLLTENNYCSVHKTEHLVFSSVNTNPNYLAWMTGELIFDNQSMATVTDMLAQYYQVEFQFENMQVASCTFSGTFQNKNIEYILNQIQNTTHCTIAKQEGIFTITGKPCSKL